MESKIPYRRFRGEEYDKDGDVFGEMLSVSIEYLQGLSRNDLDAIPMPWLYDWAKVNGLDGYKDVQDWLESLRERRNRERAIELPKKQSAIRYIGYIDRRNLYYIKYKGGRKKCELYDGFCFVNGKRFTLNDLQTSRFRKAYRKFKDDLAAAQSRQDGFHRVSKEDMTTYFKRLPDTNVEYQFITLMANGDIRCDEMKVLSYGVEFNFLGAEKCDSRVWMSSRDEPPIDDNFILLNTDDEYLNKELQYIRNKATKEDMEYLRSIDGYPRFFRDKETYGLEDFEIIDVERILPTYFNRSRRYTVRFVFEGKKYSACYHYEGKGEFIVIGHIRNTNVGITKDLNKHIRKLIDELPDDWKYDNDFGSCKKFFATLSNADKSVNLTRIINKMGLEYQRIQNVIRVNAEEEFVVWNTAYSWETFEEMMKKLNELFKQPTVCIGRYSHRRYEVSLLKSESLDEIKYQTVDTFEAKYVVEALDKYNSVVALGDGNSVELSDLQKNVCATSSVSMCGAYSRMARFNTLKRCETPLQLQEALNLE